MTRPRVLIVDDEKNIRLTITQSLASLEVETDAAENGAEALAKVRQGDFALLLLDLRMPGMDGMEVLKQLKKDRPEIRVIVITAFGTIDSAVDAMKYGAVDFIQKPFRPNEIRDLVSRVIRRESLKEGKARDYQSLLELAKKCAADQHFKAAAEHVQKALALDPSRPEGFNFLGALLEVQGEKLEAQKNYRAALSLDPTYKPARDNLNRSTKARPGGTIQLDQETSL